MTEQDQEDQQGVVGDNKAVLQRPCSAKGGRACRFVVADNIDHDPEHPP